MPIDFENDYLPLREAAEKMGLSYSTAHQYCIRDMLEGAILFRGTRWLISKLTIEKWINGEISVKGAFRKRD